MEEIKLELVLDYFDLQLIDRIRKKTGIGDYGRLLYIIETLQTKCSELYAENFELKMKLNLQNCNSKGEEISIDSRGFPGDD